MRRLAMLLLRCCALMAGLWVLYHCGVVAMGGKEKLWLFEKMEAHRYTAMSIITGSLKLRAGLAKLGHDEQAFNGAVYSNWGFGVPLLQVPFHLAAAKMKSLPQKFFPDRAIYFAYFMAFTPVIWAGFDRLFALRERAGASKLRRHVLSWATTMCVVAIAFYPLMSCRFIVYEETISYFMLAEFLAVAAYIFAQRSWSTLAVVGLGVAAGWGLLIRPTGLIYLGMWSTLLVLQRRRLGTLLAFAGATAPFVAFWMVSNWIRTGTPFGIGINNSMPWNDYHTPMVRFGSVCADTPAHAKMAAWRLFNTFFTFVDGDAKKWPWLEQCHFTFEDRPPIVGDSYAHEPYFGPFVLAGLIWMVLHQLRRRAPLATYVPAGVFVLLFGTFVWAGAGFAWRYAGDFWPVIVLAGVQYVLTLPRTAQPYLGYALALALLAPSYATYKREVEPHVSTIDVLDDFTSTSMYDDFTNSRFAQDKPLSNHIRCGDRADWLYHQGQGWLPNCKVDTFTNLFIGVPSKNDTHYTLQFKTEGVSAPTLRVYFNGRIYTTRRAGDSYIADVTIHFDRLTSPIVLTTIEWTKEFDPPPYRLLSVELS